MKRIPTLDGWRGIAILLVLFEHVWTWATGRYTHPWEQTGQHGVTLFFVLSGYLITNSLLGSGIDLKSFYIRRFFRLMPAAWAYLLTLYLLWKCLRVPFTSWAELFACLFFYRNFIGAAGGGVAGHFWSLSLEEQFYLVWPSLLFFLRKKRAAITATILIALCALWRSTHHDFYSRVWYAFHAEVRIDEVLTGCLLAILLSFPRFEEPIKSLAWRWRHLWLTGFVACVLVFHWLPPLAESILIALLIAGSLAGRKGLIQSILSFSALRWLGRISYSIYVWQQLFLTHYDGADLRLAALILLPVVALSSYYFIEQPLNHLGHRLTQPGSSRFERSFLFADANLKMVESPEAEG